MAMHHLAGVLKGHALVTQDCQASDLDVETNLYNTKLPYEEICRGDHTPLRDSHWGNLKISKGTWWCWLSAKLVSIMLGEKV